MFLRPPHVRYTPVPVNPPVRGVWSVLNSPGSAVPSHGVRAYGQTYAVDVLRRDPDAAFGWRDGFRRPERFDAFGEPVHAIADGTVVRAVDRWRDHLSRTSWPALVYLLTVETVRELGAPGAVVGNHVVIDHGNGVFSLVAHLRRRSLRVHPGQLVRAGDVLGEVGNSGNTSEPHVHVQLMDRARPTSAAGIPFFWPDARVVVGPTDPAPDDSVTDDQPSRKNPKNVAAMPPNEATVEL